MKFHKKEAYGIRFTVIENGFLPPEGYSAMYLGCVFTRNFNELTDNVMRHEAIHCLQSRELLYVGHIVLYLLEYVAKLCVCRKADVAYKSVSTEQEAYVNSRNLNYRQERKRFAFAKYLFKMYKQ